MAVATATPSLNRPSDFTGRSIIVEGTVAVSPNPATYATGGIAMSFLGFDDIKSSSPPTDVQLWSQPAAGTSPSGYEYSFTPGSGQGNGLLSIFTGAAAQSPLTELTNAAAIPAAVSGDTIFFRAEFPRL